MSQRLPYKGATVVPCFDSIGDCSTQIPTAHTQIYILIFKQNLNECD